MPREFLLPRGFKPPSTDPVQRRAALITALCVADYGTIGEPPRHAQAVCQAVAEVADRDVAPLAQVWLWHDHLQQLINTADVRTPLPL